MGQWGRLCYWAHDVGDEYQTPSPCSNLSTLFTSTEYNNNSPIKMFELHRNYGRLQLNFVICTIRWQRRCHALMAGKSSPVNLYWLPIADCKLQSTWQRLILSEYRSEQKYIWWWRSILGGANLKNGTAGELWPETRDCFLQSSQFVHRNTCSPASL